MATYKTAMGKTVDMSQLVAKNELTRAVGNMGVNARGDKIDGSGRIIKPVTDVINEKYAQTVGQRSAQNRSGAVEPDSIRTGVDLSQLNEIERELETDEDAIAIEAMKAAEVKAAMAKAKGKK